MGMDKYIKVKKIGEGSFGKAYLVKAKDQPGKQFVIKEINMGKMGRKEREESRKEVAVLAQMQHPNIVSYRESFEEISNLYIVMDYCDGGDLYGKINAQRGVLFPEDQILDWFVQICLSIKHIHDRKILHRDIKSQNIFLTRGGMVKLGDFGIAKVLNSTVELARTCIGTPYYLSPEICENRPYNNKSDVWSLGCVLYELATLKHAFEAGNMKNLVLKIIRGSYPPVAPKYSYELRMLVAQLFKRSPRDRPSVNAVLKKPFIQRRIQKFLSDTELQSEFSHTVMHGHKVKKQLPPGPAARQLPLGPAARQPSAVNQAAKRPISAPVKRYNPAKAYGQPVKPVRKSNDKENRSSADKKRPPNGGAGGMVGGAVGGVAGAMNQRNDDVNRRRQELVEREKQRQQDQKKADYARQHRDLIEKQRMDRMKKAREEGWKNLVSSLGSNNGDDKQEKSEVKQPAVRATPAPKPAPAQDRGDYDKYHAYLDKIQAEQDDRMRAAAVGDMPDPMAVDPPSARPMAGWPGRDAVKQEISRADNAGFNFAQEAKQKAGEAAERAKQVEEFLNRKREAALYRQRGKADIFGNPVPSYDEPSAQKRARPAPAASRNPEEQDYLARLRQIRLQNFQERRAMKAKQGGGVDEALGDPKFDPEARRKKIEALREQADARAKQLKEQLEKKRENVFAKQKQQWKQQQEQQNKAAGGARRAVGERQQQRAVGEQRAIGQQRAVGQQRAAGQRAVPVAAGPGMTNVMQAIGAQQPEKPIAYQGVAAGGMTNVMAAIGVSVEDEEDQVSESVESSPLQKKKQDILKKLNEKPPPARGKWGAPVQPAFEPAVERPKWGEEAVNLKGLKLEATASNMEATSAADLVVKNPDNPQVPVRKQWGGPAGTALNFLQGAKLIDGTTMNIETEKPTEPAETIVVSKSPAIAKGTMVISSPKPSGDDKQEPTADSIPDVSEDKPDSVDRLSPSKPAPKSAWGENQSPNKSGRKSPRPRTPKSSANEGDETRLSKSGRKSTSPRPRTPKSPSTVDAGDGKKLNKSGRKSTSPKTPREGSSPVDEVKAEDVKAKVASPQRLFEKVQLDDDEEEKVDATDLELEEIENDDSEDGPIKISSLKGASAGVVIGVTIGHFDVSDRRMLRTCSLPDLSSLFRTAVDNPFLMEPVSASVDVDYMADDLDGEGVQDEDLHDEVEQNDDDDNNFNSGDEGIEENLQEEEDESEGSDVDEEDMKSLRETMEKLLHGDDTKKRKKVKKSKKQTAKKTGKSISPCSDESLEQEDEVDASVEIQGTIVPGKEEWESDHDDEDGNDTMFGDSPEDTFCRLEESRLELEDELGCDVFMKAYKTVQAIHEDEDEAIEDGQKLLTTILGKPKEHLYQKILKLVVADGAYLEDNE